MARISLEEYVEYCQLRQVGEPHAWAKHGKVTSTIREGPTEKDPRHGHPVVVANNNIHPHTATTTELTSRCRHERDKRGSPHRSAAIDFERALVYEWLQRFDDMLWPVNSLEQREVTQVFHSDSAAAV